MAWTFNPFSGTFDQKGSGGGGASYIDGEVATYADLPLDGSATLNSAWLVRTASGVWPVTRKQAGIYIRTATGGSNRDSDYTYAGTMPDVFSDSQFLLYDNTDTSKNLAFDLGSITTGTTRTLTAPNASGRIQIEGQPIGNTTPAAGTFTTLTGSTQIVGPQGTNVGSATANAITLGAANTGFHVSNTQLVAVKQGAGVWYANNTNVFVVSAGMTGGMAIEQTGAPLTFSRNIQLFPDANGELHQRSTTQSQSHFLYNTYTSSTNHERGFLRWSSNVFQIGTEKGSSGGTVRNLEFQTDGATRVTIDQSALRTGTTKIILGSGTNIEWGSGAIGIQSSTSASPAYFKIFTASTDRLIIDPNGLLCLGGTTSSFPALKRSSATLQVRLADDSAYSVIDAQLRSQGTAPATSGATGTAGDIRYDADYIYVCTATNTWKRAAIATW